MVGIENGILKSECQHFQEMGHGEAREYYQNGVLKSCEQIELGIEISYQEWDLNGLLIEERKLQEGSDQHQFLLKLRGEYPELNINSEA